MAPPRPLDAEERAYVADVTRLVDAARAALPQSAAPCFAHLRVNSRGDARDYLLGPQTLTGDAVTILRWDQAPLAEAFFAAVEGGDYELRVGAQVIAGVVLARSLLALDHGALVAVTRAGTRFSRGEDGTWSASPDTGSAPLRPRPDGRRRPPSAVEVTLDADQQRVVDLPAGAPLLVLGEAGVGKTTVALRRLAALRQRHGDRPWSAAVIVPTEGLRRLTEALLERLGLEGVEVAMYDRWAAKIARRAFHDIPVRESEDALPGVLRLKRHRALAEVLPDFAALPPADPRRRAGRADLHHLFGDREWMEKVAARSDEVSARDVTQVLDHTRIQFMETTEDSFGAGVDRGRLATADGRSIDAGTRYGDVKTVDVEDYAVLFELDRLRAKQRGERCPLPRRYDALVLDESQELAPLELRLLGRAVAQGGTLVVAGDAGQQVDVTACFTDWHTSMRDLGAASHTKVTLATNYRCHPTVTALARHVLDPASPAPPFTDEGPVGFLPCANECHLAARLIDGLRELVVDDPRASIAVVARTPESARRVASWLRRGVDVRLALEGDFHFGPGIQVTAVREVKGLEFDHVVIPDASTAAYPEGGEGRRALYVAVTRAAHRVVFATTGRWTELLGDAAPNAPARTGVSPGDAEPIDRHG